MTIQKSYNCDLCRDVGWVVIEQEKYQPLMRRCECAEKEFVKEKWIKAGINPSMSNLKFSTFKAWNETSENLRLIGKSYLKNFKEIKDNKQNSLLLCGQVGSGKTHISIAVALNLLNIGVKVLYFGFRDVVTGLKQNMLDQEYYKQNIDTYQNAEVLLIDDLFKGKITDADKNIMFEILNYRYLNNLPIIVSSELTVQDVLIVDEAIGSRIYEMCKNYTLEIQKDINNNYRLK